MDRLASGDTIEGVAPPAHTRKPAARTRSKARTASAGRKGRELVIITGLSGSGKATVLNVFEDLGYYCVDNLPTDLIHSFIELATKSPDIRSMAIVVDIREGERLERVPTIIRALRGKLDTRVLFLEASDDVLVRRFSETRRPHPIGGESSVKTSIAAERKRLAPIRALADHVVDTSRFNVHELKAHVRHIFEHEKTEATLLVSCVSFGFRNGVPNDADLVFDVRFLPNPHFVAEFRPLTGKHPRVAKYVRSFPQTREFIDRISDLLVYLLPHYIAEGKSYLTLAFGCTGGQHRSVMMAEEVRKRLAAHGYKAKVSHRDCPK
jgi:RNase adapter protein RapZ